MDKTLKDMQKQTDAHIRQFKNGYFTPQDQMLRLFEEVGELSREINHHYGAKKKKESEPFKEISDELGDVLFVLTALANSLGIQLEDSFDKVLKKYQIRDKDRFEREE